MADESGHVVLLAYLPYSDDSDAIEQAIEGWLANPQNLQYFTPHEPIQWTATVSIMMQGYGKDRRSVRLVGHNPVHFLGAFSKASKESR